MSLEEEHDGRMRVLVLEATSVTELDLTDEGEVLIEERPRRPR